MALITAAEFLECYDARVIGDLVKDDDTRPSASALLSDTVVAAVLTRASGQVESALVTGGRYTAAALAALTGNAKGHLIQVVADVAMSLLFSRRALPEWAEQRATFEQVKDTHLERLRNGENVFNLEDQIDAGLPTLATPSLVDIQRRNGLRQSVGCIPFFPKQRFSW